MTLFISMPSANLYWVEGFPLTSTAMQRAGLAAEEFKHRGFRRRPIFIPAWGCNRLFQYPILVWVECIQDRSHKSRVWGLFILDRCEGVGSGLKMGNNHRYVKSSVVENSNLLCPLPLEQVKIHMYSFIHDISQKMNAPRSRGWHYVASKKRVDDEKEFGLTFICLLFLPFHTAIFLALCIFLCNVVGSDQLESIIKERHFLPHQIHHRCFWRNSVSRRNGGIWDAMTEAHRITEKLEQFHRFLGKTCCNSENIY